MLDGAMIEGEELDGVIKMIMTSQSRIEENIRAI